MSTCFRFYSSVLVTKKYWYSVFDIKYYKFHIKMRCVCIVFHRYSNEYDTKWQLKRLVNQVWWNMFISFVGWNHWQHCMNNKLNTFTKWYVWLFYLLFILSHLNKSIYYLLNNIRYTWPKYWTIILINCFREWFVSMHSVDTNWYSLVQLINKYVLYVCYILAYGDIFSV